eukprot:GEMP01001508.1.p1 GENE.GEMP01001508.1~~GEMP01001508.1.p1  ORF type:complete len:1064 (+),score=238.24 GEMP01001508.1:97-3288(+)
MENAYKKAIQDVIKDVDRYKKSAKALVVQFKTLSNAASKVLLPLVLHTLKDFKKSDTQKLLILLVLDDATDSDKQSILQAVDSGKLMAYFEKAQSKGGGFFATLTKDEAISQEVLNSITSYLWKWSSFVSEMNIPNVSHIRAWRQKNGNSLPIGFNSDVYLVYRPVGELIKETAPACLGVGGLREPNKAAPNLAQQASANVSSPSMVDLGQASPTRRSSMESKHYDAEDAKKLCVDLVQLRTPTLREEAQFMISYFEGLANSAAGNDNYEDYEKYAEISGNIHNAIREHDKLMADGGPATSVEAIKEAKSKDKKEKKKKKTDKEKTQEEPPVPVVIPESAFPAQDLFGAFPPQKEAFVDARNQSPQDTSAVLDGGFGDAVLQETRGIDGTLLDDRTVPDIGKPFSLDGARLTLDSFPPPGVRDKKSSTSVAHPDLGRGIGSLSRNGHTRPQSVLDDNRISERGSVDEDVPGRLAKQMKMLNAMARRQEELQEKLHTNAAFQSNEFSQAVIARQKSENSARDLNQLYHMAMAQYRSTETKNEENEQGLILMREQNAKLMNERNEFARQLEEVRANFRQLQARFENQDEILQNARERLLDSQSKLADCMQELETRKEVQKTLQQRLYEARTSQRFADDQLGKMRHVFDSTECTQSGDKVEFRAVEPDWDAYQVSERVQHGDELAAPATTKPNEAVSANKEVPLPTATFEFPYQRLQGPPFSAEEKPRLETLYRNMCQATKGLLYSDASVELFIHIEASAPLLTCNIVVRNICNANIGDIEISPTPTNPDGPPPLEIRPQGCISARPNGEVQFTARLIANQPYMGLPSIHLAYLCLDNSQITTRIRLPMSCVRLCTPIELRTQVFFEYWRDADMEAQAGFRGPVRDVFFENGGFFLFVKSVELGSFKTLPGVAASNDTIVLAGIYPRQARRSEVLVRADLNHADRTITVIVRSSSFLISNAAARALADVLIISKETPRKGGAFARVINQSKLPPRLPSSNAVQHSPWIPRDPRLNVDDWIVAERNAVGGNGAHERDQSESPWVVANGPCRFLRPSQVPHRKMDIAS